MNKSTKLHGQAIAHSSTLIGLNAHAIRVEVRCSRKTTPFCFQIIGLPEAAARETRVRVTSALANLGVLLDKYSITVNLVPTDLRKNGAALDVAIACGVLGSLGKVQPWALENLLLLGELSLDGRLRPVRGVLPLLEGARQWGMKAIVPEGNAAEAGLAHDLHVLVAPSLAALVAHLGFENAPTQSLTEAPQNEFQPSLDREPVDFKELHGQTAARRALEIAAAGNHNLLMIGPPGSGKTLLARLLPTILPPLSFDETLETTAIHSVAGLVDSQLGVIQRRPFRAPHHTVSDTGLVGGGDIPRPGELSLAHNGVLFLDELAEFRRNALEALYQPLEDGHVCITRARTCAWFPARPLVVAAINPCPCGYRGHPSKSCHCTDEQRRRYQERLSKLPLNLFDVCITVPPINLSAIRKHGESSATIRERVIVVHERCKTRLKTAFDLACHNTVGNHPSIKTLRVARTIADLEGSEKVHESHIAEATQLTQQPA